jgi:hypothetical protein
VARKQWPGVLESVRPPNAGLRLFGGAAFERCLNEFQEAANALCFPTGARVCPGVWTGARTRIGLHVLRAIHDPARVSPCTAAASVARDRIANVLLARKGRDNLGGAARAAEDIARQVGAI